jgi:hypothetical protein
LEVFVRSSDYTPNGVVRVTDEDVHREADEIARQVLNVSGAEAWELLDRGELDDKAIAAELRALRYLLRDKGGTYRAQSSKPVDSVRARV